MCSCRYTGALLVWTVENVWKWNDDRKYRRRACVLSMRTKSNLCHNVQFYRFRTFQSRQSKTLQNICVDANRSIRVRWQRKRILLKKHLCELGLRAYLHEGGGPQVGEVTCGGLPHLTCKRDHIKTRDCMDRRVTPPKRVTSPIWGTPPPCKQVLRNHMLVGSLLRVIAILSHVKATKRVHSCLGWLVFP